MKKLTKNIIEKLVLEVLDEATTSTSTTGMPPGWHQAKAKRDTAHQKWTQHLDIKPDTTTQQDQTYYAEPEGTSDVYAGTTKVEPGKPAGTRHATQSPFRNVVVQGTTSATPKIAQAATKTLSKLDTAWGTTSTTSPDTTRWTHPYSNVTTDTSTTAQPKGGWQYDQHKVDDTKWTHPYSNVTTAVSKKAPQPVGGWEVVKTANKQKGQYIHPYSKNIQMTKLGQQIPSHGWQEVPGAGVVGNTRFFQGSTKDYKQAPIPKKGWTRSTAEPVKFSDTTYGQGGALDYDKARKDSLNQLFPGTFSTFKKTTNPFNMLSPGKRAYGQGTKSQYQTAAAGAAAAGQSGYQEIKPTTNPNKTSTTFSKEAPFSYKASSGEGGTVGQSSRTVTVPNPEYDPWKDQEGVYKSEFDTADEEWKSLTPQGGSRESEGPPPPTAGGTSRGGRAKGKGKRSFSRGRKGRGRARSIGGKRGFSYKASKASKSGWGKGKASTKTKGKKGKKGREDEAFRSSILKDIILELKDLEKYNK
jgi:hypothetical protein